MCSFSGSLVVAAVSAWKSTHSTDGGRCKCVRFLRKFFGCETAEEGSSDDKEQNFRTVDA
jgi:hypothetical protein